MPPYRTIPSNEEPNIDYEQLKINLDRARKIYSNLEKDIEIFFEQWAET
jgi:hypothetical protein